MLYEATQCKYTRAYGCVFDICANMCEVFTKLALFYLTPVPLS